MEQLKITDFDLSQMCRLCLSRDTSKADIFLFSSDLGKKIADVIMACIPVQISKQDKMPTNICQLCFTQLKKFHQFQMQVIHCDKKLKHCLQQLSNCHPQFHVELALDEQSDNFANENYNSDVAAECEHFENNDEFNIFYPKQKMITNFIAVNKISEHTTSEVKHEPMVDKLLIPAECLGTVEFLSEGDSKISCEDSRIKISNAGVDTGKTEKIWVKSEENPCVPLKEADSSVCSENIEDVEWLRSNGDNHNRTERASKRQNFNEKYRDFRKISLKKSPTSTGGKSHYCDICQMCFRQACYLKKHKLIHTGEKPYKCDVCKMCFRQSGSLKKHNLIHTGEKPYRCDACQMCFSESSNLKRHKLIHTGEKPYRCDTCQMCFRHADKLKSHNLTHTGEKPYQCETCKMCFRELKNLKRHNLVHTGEKPYQCDICKMYFRQSSSLKTHKLKHTGEKPHECDICKMCFRQTVQLKIHKLKHTGEKPFQCDICKKCFSESGTLKVHKVIHTGEKPYQCDICKICFRRYATLKDHKLKHTGEKPYRCDICKLCFRHSNSLRRHKLKHSE